MLTRMVLHHASLFVPLRALPGQCRCSCAAESVSGRSQEMFLSLDVKQACVQRAHLPIAMLASCERHSAQFVVTKRRDS